MVFDGKGRGVRDALTANAFTAARSRQLHWPSLGQLYTSWDRLVDLLFCSILRLSQRPFNRRTSLAMARKGYSHLQRMRSERAERMHATIVDIDSLRDELRQFGIRVKEGIGMGRVRRELGMFGTGRTLKLSCGFLRHIGGSDGVRFSGCMSK